MKLLDIVSIEVFLLFSVLENIQVEICKILLKGDDRPTQVIKTATKESFQGVNAKGFCLVAFYFSFGFYQSLNYLIIIYFSSNVFGVLSCSRETQKTASASDKEANRWPSVY